LLEALAGQFAEQALARISKVLDDPDPDLDALTCLNTFLAAGGQDKLENAATAWVLFEAMFRPENLIPLHRINTAVGALLAPVLTDIIRQGVADGVFDTFDPEGAADMILQLGTSTYGIMARALAAGDADQMDEAIQALERRVRLYEMALDRVLGLPDRSV
jgi:hypothetical protein